MNQPGSLVNQMTAVLRGNFGRLWMLALWPSLAEAAAIVLVRPFTRSLLLSKYGPISPMNLWQSMGVGARCVILLVFVVQVCLPRDLAIAGVTIGVWRRLENEEIAVRSAIARLARILPILLVLSIVAGSLVVGGTMLLILPGVFFAILTAFVMPSLATAQKGAWAAARKSLGLSMRSFGPLLLLILAMAMAGVVAVCALMIPIAVTADGSNGWMGLVVGLILFLVILTLAVMVYAVGVAVLYRNALRGAAPYPGAQEAI